MHTHTPTHAHTPTPTYTHHYHRLTKSQGFTVGLTDFTHLSRSHSHVEAILPMLYIVHIIYDLLQVNHQQCMAVHGVVLMNKI